MSSEASASTPRKFPFPPSMPVFGLGTSPHSLPFQCSVSVLPPASLDMSATYLPTAHASLVERASTASSVLGASAFGLETMVQAAPSQCWMSVFVPSLLSSWNHPTAHAFVGETAVTPKRLFSPEPTFGLATTGQAVRCSAGAPCASGLLTTASVRAQEAKTPTRTTRAVARLSTWTECWAVCRPTRLRACVLTVIGRRVQEITSDNAGQEGVSRVGKRMASETQGFAWERGKLARTCAPSLPARLPTEP